MADQLGERVLNMTNARVNGVKEEEYGDFANDKDHVSEIAIITENTDLQGNLIYDEMKQYDISTTLDNIKIELSSSEVQYNMVHINLKIEEGISPNDIKIELNNGLLYCEHCHAHCDDYCIECGMLVHILNKTVPINKNTKSKELPNDILDIHEYFGEYHICALKSIPAGIRFGPFTGLNTTEHSWKIKGGKFVVNNDKSKCLNWMQYINHARSIFEQNLLVFRYGHSLYFESTCQIQVGDELLVHFGEEYEDSLNGNVKMDFTPTTEYIFKGAFACTFCCLGYSSKSYLAKHKAICPENAGRGFSIEELMQCPSCKIHLDKGEYILHHMPYCSEGNDSKYNQTTVANGRKILQRLIHKCQQCKYRTKYIGDLKNHTNQHHEVKTYKCEGCCRRFKTKEVLRLHVGNTRMCAGGKRDSERSTGDYMKAPLIAEHSHTQDETKPFKCSICEFRTKYKSNLRTHLKTKHLRELNYKCNLCEYESNWKCNLTKHIEAKHLKEFRYRCDRCDYKTNYKFLLKRHIKTIHLREFKYKCGTCGYESNCKSNMKKHIETKHLNEFKHKCPLCAFRTKYKESLKTHMKVKHLRELKYKCDTCEYKTHRKSNLRKHTETKHLKEFRYKCDTCDYKTNYKALLKNHIAARHLMEFKYKCEICDYKANRKNNLKMHIETRHLKEFRYQCDTCGYKTNWKSTLKNHIEASHLKELKYRCGVCDYKTNREHHLKRHVVARHLKEFKYKCDTCDYKATRKDNLKMHVERRHLNEFKYRCDTCDYKANNKSILKKHVVSAHSKKSKCRYI